MLMEDRLIKLLNDHRPYIIESYERFNRTEAGSKFSSDDPATVAGRINELLNQFIVSFEQNDPSIYFEYAKKVTQVRLAEGYSPEAIIRLWDWGLFFFTNMIENFLWDDPDKASYLRHMQALLNTAKLLVANANLDHINEEIYC